MIIEGLLARVMQLESEIAEVRDRLAALENPNRPIVPQTTSVKNETAPATVTTKAAATTPPTGKTTAK